MNQLDQLHADLAWAAVHGAEQAGAEAVDAGMHHVGNAQHALLNVESVTSQHADPLHARVTATKPASVGGPAPALPGVTGAADVMAEVAANVGTSVLGKRS